MNTIESTALVGPYGKEDSCAKFVIDELTYPYKFSNVAAPGTTYTLSLWAKSDESGSISTGGKVFQTSTAWTHCPATFTATSNDVYLYFVTPGTYYVYHAQLEIGTKATDWTPSPEDVDQSIDNAQSTADNAQSSADDAQTRADDAHALIEILEGAIVSTVVDENGTTKLIQTGSGWTFDMTSLEDTVSNTSEQLGTLQTEHNQTVSDVTNLQGEVRALGEKTAYIDINKDGETPYLELGTRTDDGNPSPFRVRITNTSIDLRGGTSTPARIENNPDTGTSYFHIEKGIIEDELQQGGFVWQARDNGNLGLIWIGG